MLIDGGDVNVIAEEVEQLALSNTVKVYEFEYKEVMLDVVAPVFQEYEYGAIPPVMVVVIAPSFVLKQVGFVKLAAILGELTVNVGVFEIIFLQPTLTTHRTWSKFILVFAVKESELVVALVYGEDEFVNVPALKVCH